MALTASAPVLTARGDELNEIDGFIADFSVVKRIARVAAVPAGEKTKGRDERSAHTLIDVGNCGSLNIDSDTGFVGMYTVLQYTELLCSGDEASLKKAVTSWFKKPTSVAIATALLRRDRGTSQFFRKVDGAVDIFVHPTQLLANVEVGASTRTWLVSAAAFVSSYNQISKAFEQSPRDFSRMDDHVDALHARVKVLNSRSGARKLIESALATTKPPYADFNYQSVAHDALNRLALLARADLAAMKYLRKIAMARSVASETAAEDPKAKKSRRKSPEGGDVTTLEITVEQLRFLKDVADANGDLWFERSAHTYDLGEQSGAVVVFPSGYLYSIVGSEGTTSQQLMKERTALSRMESIIPYLPCEFSGYTGDMATLALLEAKKRDKKVAAKMDHETARTAIMNFATRLATSMIVDPLMLDLQKRVTSKSAEAEVKSKPKKEAAPPPPPPKAAVAEPEAEPEEDDDEEKSAPEEESETEEAEE